MFLFITPFHLSSLVQTYIFYYNFQMLSLGTISTQPVGILTVL